MLPGAWHADIRLEHFDHSESVRDAQGRSTAPSSTKTVRDCSYGVLSSQEMFDLGVGQQQRMIVVRVPTAEVVAQGDIVTLPTNSRLPGRYSVQSVVDTALDRRVLCVRAVS